VASRAQEILRGVAAASAVLHRYEMGSRTGFDVLQAALDLEIPVMFRPLKGLWGATITVTDDLRGILVTTKLGLHVQRFTLAHELGHYLLGHKIQLDPTVGFAGRYGPKSLATSEIAADAFAAELLASRRYILAAAQRHRWTRAAFSQAHVVYQLSLRLGISYVAACWALAAHELLTQSQAREMSDLTVQELKRELLAGNQLEDSWADVWNLTANDSGSFLEAGPRDVFAVQLKDAVSGGFVWELVDAGDHARVIREELVTDSPLYGDPTTRVVYLMFDAPGIHRLAFAHRRPWNEQTLAHIDISVDSYGKEVGGMPRRERLQALAGAAI
jgi:Zn-dependent peptidase ImmA (M78 family)